MSRAFGAARIDLPFLIASPTKRMTASGVLWLRDQRELALSDPVTKYLPEFRGHRPSPSAEAVGWLRSRNEGQCGRWPGVSISLYVYRNPLDEENSNA